ncbi:MAG TPA: hypothetical protein VM285_03485 [Polyangia bacterium]|nr:hypothetical protein [Polyangia bacterium]
MTNSQTPPGKQAPDPLGMVPLRDIVSRLIQLRDESQRPERWSLLVDQLDAAFDRTAELYEMLKDRYLLLKRHTAQLEDELGWLRDQVDDLASFREEETVPEEPDRSRPRRRLEDRNRR